MSESAPTTLERLATERNLWLATVRPDGRPHLVPLWFVWVDGAFWIGTGARSAKARNLAAEPRAAVSLEDGNAPVAAEVVASVVPRPFPVPVVDAFAATYGWDITVDEDEDVGQLAVYELRPTRWLFGAPD